MHPVIFKSICFVFVISIGVVILLRPNAPQSPPKNTIGKNNPSISREEIAEIEKNSHINTNSEIKVQELVENEVNKLTIDKQERISVAFMNNKNISPKSIDAILEIISDKKKSNLIRNNYAVALLNQEEIRGDLDTIFLEMLDDESENEVWRDYSMQYLTRLIPQYNSGEEIKKKIMDYALNTDGNLAASAVILLHFSSKTQKTKLPDEYYNSLYHKLDTSETSNELKAAILTTIPGTNNKNYLGKIREFLSSDNAVLRRAAIHSLSVLGDESDVDLIKENLNHRNKSVVMAAQSATKSLLSGDIK